jgi:hypothetical protein
MSTVSGHTDKLSSAEKRALLAQLLRKKAQGRKSFPLSSPSSASGSSTR